MQRSLPFVDDPLFDEHRPRGYHPERPERLVAARAAIAECESAGLAFSPLAPRDATETELERVHAAAYLERLSQHRGLFGSVDDDTYIGPRSVAAAERAAGGALALVDSLLEEGGPGIALLRPPGHHARPSTGMGFCLLNNIAVAAEHARAQGLERVAIIDWDVHHGNGTQEAFYDRPDVLFVSLHQAPFYPGTGRAEETGSGEGTGYTVNIPLSPGAGDDVYHSAFERIVLPVLELYRPEMLLISAGFDAHERDPLAGMSLTAEGFEAMARQLSLVAARSAGGRAAMLLEGGYDLQGLESSLAAALLGLSQPVARTEAVASPLSMTHQADLTRAESAAKNRWRI